MNKYQRGFTAVEALIVLAVVAVLGGAGYFVWHRDSNKKNAASSTATSQNSAAASTSPSPTTKPDPYAGWKTYSSAFEKLSFKYPPNWNGVKVNNASYDKADAFQLTSPSGAVSVSWYSEVDGLGGACIGNIVPGKKVDPGPCSYWYVVSKQKLTGANLYFVAGVVTDDGTTYSPWCGLQPPDGIVKNENRSGYMLFKGKNNNVVRDGKDYGLQLAGLFCSKIPGNWGGELSMKGTKAQATAYLSKPEMQQAKLLLLSATY